MKNNIETKIRKGVSNGAMSWDTKPGEEFEYDKETSRILNLLDTCENVDVFKHESRMYFGVKERAVKEYIKNNPTPADFSVWLQKNYKEVL